MTHHHHGTKKKTHCMDETSQHVLAAGRELLLAAQGALRFCKNYVETQVPTSNRANLMNFFGKAIRVADELGDSICGVTSITRTAEKFAKPFLSAMDFEMKKTTPTKKRPRKVRKQPK
jgi:hypothetical protein